MSHDSIMESLSIAFMYIIIIDGPIIFALLLFFRLQSDSYKLWRFRRKYSRLKLEWGERLFVAPGADGEVIVAYPSQRRFVIETPTGEPILHEGYSLYLDSSYGEQKCFKSLENAIKYSEQCAEARAQQAAELQTLRELHLEYLNQGTVNKAA